MNGDYDSLGTTVFATISYASYSTTAYNDFSLDANGIANIDIVNVNSTEFGTRLTWDTTGTFGGVWSSGLNSNFSSSFADAAGTTQDPKLVVIFSLPGSYSFFMS